MITHYVVANHENHKYDYPLIATDAFANTIIGRFINRYTNNWPNRVISWFIDSKSAEICSELVGICLQKIPLLKNVGCLKLPPRMITPQILAGDDKVFVPMRDSVS